MNTQRLFNGTDAQMAEAARVVHQQLLQDLTTFSNFSTRFNIAYADAFLAKINAADQVVTDNELLSQQVVKTENVLNAMDNARLMYRRAKAYAELSFSVNESVILQEFTRGYLEARQNQPKMIVFLETLQNALERHQATLQDATKGGMPATFITEVQAVRQQLQEKNVVQETFINTRKTITESRLEILNNCYKNMIEINNFAQVVFEDSVARRSIYTYNSASSGSNIQTFTGTVAPSEYKTIHTMPQQASTFISFENKGMVPLLFDLAAENTPNNATSFAGNVIDLGGGAVITQSMQWLNDALAEGSQSKILVHNPSATETASYEVNINVE